MEDSNNIQLPNYTQTPNVIYDYWMPILSCGAFKVLSCMCRKIFGWHKTSDTISKNQIIRATGMSKNTVQTAIEELEKNGLVIKFQNKTEYGHQPNTFSLKIDKPIDVLYQEFEGGDADQKLGGGRSKIDPGVGQKLTQGVGQKLTPQKKDITKERLTKDMSSPSLGLFDFFFSSLQSINPKIKAPNGKAWRSQLQQMIDEDNRTEDEIRKVIDYIVEQHNTSDADFTWSKAVQSPEKLRKHFATIWLEMNKRKGKKPKDEAMEQEIKRYEENKAWAAQVYKKNIDLIKKSGNMFSVSDNVVWMKNGNSVTPLGYDVNGFKEQVTSFLRKNNLWNP